jgi:hypothetical protein
MISTKLGANLKPGTFPVVRQLVIIDTIVALIVMIYGMVIGILILKGSPRGRRLAQQYLVVRIPGQACDRSNSVDLGIQRIGARGAQIMSTKTMPQMLLEITVCLLWLAYFVCSRRVREAYSTP